MVVDGDDPGVMASTRLHGTLREFGFDARTSEAVVVIERDGQVISIKPRIVCASSRQETIPPTIGPIVSSDGRAGHRAGNGFCDVLAAPRPRLARLRVLLLAVPLVLVRFLRSCSC